MMKFEKHLKKVKKNKKTRTNLLNLDYYLKFEAREIINPGSVKKLNSQPI
jgi:hypothetical protein